MRVAISGYVGTKLTGIGRVLIEVLNEMAPINRKDEYVLFKNCDFEDYDILRKHPNIRIVDIKVSKYSSLKNILWHQWGFQRLQKKYKCDVAYIPNFSLLLWKRIPTVVTIHDLIEYNVPEKFSKVRMLYRKGICDPLMAKRSDHILTVSKSSYNDIVKYLGVKPEKITLTLNASDKNFFRRYTCDEITPAISKHNLNYKQYLLFVGTIDYPGKNIKTVIEAFFKLSNRGKMEGMKLVVVGKDGFNSQVIYDYVDNSEYKNDVVFTGYLTEEDLPKYYAGAAIMLYLSFFEGFGLPVLEAMSCGTPVICPNTSCFPEIVEDLDVMVSPTDVKAVEEKIERILSDREYANVLAERCYQKSQKYSWKDTAKIYHDVFVEMIRR